MTATPDAYFEQRWQRDDPWEQRHRWSERRKFELTVAALPDERYRSAYEPGCATGTLTRLLAPRCEHLLSTDRHPRAVAVARAAARDLPHVEVRLGRVPDDVPSGPFDLVVLSEVLYYLEPEGVRDVLDRVTEAAAPGAHLVAVHYRPEVDEHALTGQEVHDLLAADGRWRTTVRHVDATFLLDVCVLA